jgi:hypothetical protein
MRPEKRSLPTPPSTHLVGLWVIGQELDEGLGPVGLVEVHVDVKRDARAPEELGPAVDQAVLPSTTSHRIRVRTVFTFIFVSIFVLGTPTASPSRMGQLPRALTCHCRRRS